MQTLTDEPAIEDLQEIGDIELKELLFTGIPDDTEAYFAEEFTPLALKLF
jgi:hypothetical protein